MLRRQERNQWPSGHSGLRPASPCLLWLRRRWHQRQGQSVSRCGLCHGARPARLSATGFSFPAPDNYVKPVAIWLICRHSSLSKKNTTWPLESIPCQTGPILIVIPLFVNENSCSTWKNHHIRDRFLRLVAIGNFVMSVYNQKMFMFLNIHLCRTSWRSCGHRKRHPIISGKPCTSCPGCSPFQHCRMCG